MIRAVVGYILYCVVSVGLLIGATSLAEEHMYRPACVELCASKGLQFDNLHYHSGRGAPIPSGCHCIGAPRGADPATLECRRWEGNRLECNDARVFGFFARTGLVIAGVVLLVGLPLIAFMRWGLGGSITQSH